LVARGEEEDEEEKKKVEEEEEEERSLSETVICYSVLISAFLLSCDSRLSLGAA
jgi:hypothetical protein